jgi:sugar lactone lactonase YvrE
LDKLKQIDRWGALLCIVTFGLLYGCARTQAPALSVEPNLIDSEHLVQIGSEWEDVRSIPGDRRLAFGIESKVFLTNTKQKSRVEVCRVDSLNQCRNFIDLSEWMTSFQPNTLMVSDIKVDDQGRLIIAEKGTGKLLRISPDAKKMEVLADSYDGYRFSSIEDIEIGVNGDHYLSSPESGVIYRIDPELGQVGILNENVVSPGAICIRSGHNQLIVAEPDFYRVIVFDLRKEVSSVRFRSLIDFYPQQIKPQGLAFDSQGYLYVSLGDRKEIRVFDLLKAKEVSSINTEHFAGSLFSHENILYLGGGKKFQKIEIPELY